MQLPAFDHEKKRWDKFKTFAVGHDRWGTRTGWHDHAAFYQLETGEAFTTWHSFDKPQRGLYKELNVGVFSTADDGCPKFQTAAGVAVAKAWLNRRGGQQVLVDYDTKRVVGLSWSKAAPGVGRHISNLNSLKTGMPVWLRQHAIIYFAGAGEPPVGAAVMVEPPKVWTEAEKTHLDQLRAGAQAWRTMTEAPMWSGDGKLHDPTKWLTKGLGDMTDKGKIDLARRGWATVHERIFEPYLLLA